LIPINHARRGPYDCKLHQRGVRASDLGKAIEGKAIEGKAIEGKQLGERQGRRADTIGLGQHADGSGLAGVKTRCKSLEAKCEDLETA
jgi:hypothetical protein